MSNGTENYEQDHVYLARLLKNNESSTVEVKLSMDGTKDHVAKAICGLANQRGGRVIVGLAEKKFYKPEMGAYSDADVVGDGFIVFGVSNPDKARIELSSFLRSHTNLGTNLEDLYAVSELTVNGKKVVVIKVKPYFSDVKKVILYKNEIYKRIDNQTIRLTMADLVDIFNSGPGPNNSRAMSTASMMEAVDETKDMIYDAVQVVIEADRASTSLLQRRLHIGYGRSARLIDRLEKAGVIESVVDGKARQVLVRDLEEAKNLVRGLDA